MITVSSSYVPMARVEERFVGTMQDVTKISAIVFVRITMRAIHRTDAFQELVRNSDTEITYNSFHMFALFQGACVAVKKSH